ncbi:hypothetical protein BDZ91DRAFT_711993 [Kalaharituber pfeilii]|nr:hypothetical protein BDZ91DRAFT_711993 [Kalaharituber pfeilii]
MSWDNMGTENIPQLLQERLAGNDYDDNAFIVSRKEERDGAQAEEDDLLHARSEAKLDNILLVDSEFNDLFMDDSQGTEDDILWPEVESQMGNDIILPRTSQMALGYDSQGADGSDGDILCSQAFSPLRDASDEWVEVWEEISDKGAEEEMLL